MKKKVLIIGIIVLIILALLICLIVYYNSEYIKVGYQEVGGPDLLGYEPRKEAYIIMNSREVIQYKNENKMHLGKISKDNLDKLSKIIQDEVKNKDKIETSDGFSNGSFVAINGEFYVINYRLKKELDKFIIESIVK